MVRSKEKAHRHNGKRSLDSHRVLPSAKGRGSTAAPERCRRAAPDTPFLVEDIGADRSSGTDAQRVVLDRSDKAVVIQKDVVPAGTPHRRPALEVTNGDAGDSTVLITGGLTGPLVLICTVVITLSWLKQRKQPSAGKSKARISHSSHSDTVPTGHSSSDSSEV